MLNKVKNTFYPTYKIVKSRSNKFTIDKNQKDQARCDGMAATTVSTALGTLGRRENKSDTRLLKGAQSERRVGAFYFLPAGQAEDRVTKAPRTRGSTQTMYPSHCWRGGESVTHPVTGKTLGSSHKFCAAGAWQGLQKLQLLPQTPQCLWLPGRKEMAVLLLSPSS